MKFNIFKLKDIRKRPKKHSFKGIEPVELSMAYAPAMDYSRLSALGSIVTKQ